MYNGKTEYESYLKRSKAQLLDREPMSEIAFYETGAKLRSVWAQISALEESGLGFSGSWYALRQREIALESVLYL